MDQAIPNTAPGGSTAGAAEPSCNERVERPSNNGALEKKVSSKELCVFGFYSVGIQQENISQRNNVKAYVVLRRLAEDIDEAFRTHDLAWLGLCELGQHLEGLHGAANFHADTQEILMYYVVKLANEVAAKYKREENRLNPFGAAEPEYEYAFGPFYITCSCWFVEALQQRSYPC